MPLLKRPVRLRARTPPFHGGDTGSNPVRATKPLPLAAKAFLLLPIKIFPDQALLVRSVFSLGYNTTSILTNVSRAAIPFQGRYSRLFTTFAAIFNQKEIQQ